VLLGSWPLAETTGLAFNDIAGTNDATLTIPSWTVATHTLDRPGITAGVDHSIEVSNGGPTIPQIYQIPDVNFVIYVEPLGMIRGLQHWNVSDEAHGREFIAHCDDGVTQGSFAIYRRWASITEWRLGGYVRDQNGAKQYFGGSSAGIAGVSLPADTAHRIVLSQGALGARLWLDDTPVGGTLPVTIGWSSLTHPITLGSSDDLGHANDRSPLWGRIGAPQIWGGGQMPQANVVALPAAVQSRRWRPPSDFVGAGTDINIANYAGGSTLYGVNPDGNDIRDMGAQLQVAIDAAATAGRYIYQDATDENWYTGTLQGGGYYILTSFPPLCKGYIGLKLSQRNAYANADDNGSLIRNNILSSDPYAATGGWKFYGLRLDGNEKNQDFSGDGAGTTWGGHDHQHRHGLWLAGGSTPFHAVVDACDFLDGGGAALACGAGGLFTIKSVRSYGFFRESVALLTTTNNISIDVRSMEVMNHSYMRPAVLMGPGGIYDIEGQLVSATPTETLTWVDVWAEGNWDLDLQGTASTAVHMNCHTTLAEFDHHARSLMSAQPPEFYYCTISYHSNDIRPAYTYCWNEGTNHTGVLYDHCIWLANGQKYSQENTIPATTPRFYWSLSASGAGPTVMTMRDCEARVRNLPAGIAQANVQLFDAATNTGKTIVFDGLLIDGAFADKPIEAGNMTVNYRNVLHERTLDQTPWTGAATAPPIVGTAGRKTVTVPSNGTTISNAAWATLQTTINNAPVPSKISVAPGTYTATATPIVPRNGVWLTGAGVTINTAGFLVFDLGTPHSDIWISGFTLNGVNNNGQTGNLYIIGGTNIHIVNNSFLNHGTRPIIMYGGNSIYIQGNLFQSDNADGNRQAISPRSSVGSTCDTLVISDNEIVDSTRFAIETVHAANHTNVHFDRNLIHGSGSIGMSIIGDAYLSGTIWGNEIHSRGILVGGTMVGGGIELGHGPITNITCANNYCHNNAGAGLQIARGPGSVYENNTLNANGHGPFQEDGGYDHTEWVGVNSIDGATVTGWPGKTYGTKPAVFAPSAVPT
jgi:hypothetical protein